MLEQAAAASGEILLVTDGGASQSAEEAAAELRAAGYTLSVLGVGTPQGAPIPRESGGFVTDAAGQMAIPRLEEPGLRALADAGGGRYASLTPNDNDLDHLLSGATNARAAGGDDTQATDQWREEGPWLLLALLPLAATAFRRGWAFAVVFALLPLAQPADASLWDDLWFNRNQQGQRLLEAGEAQAAAGRFKDPEWQAVSRYRAGDYAESAARFAEGTRCAQPLQPRQCARAAGRIRICNRRIRPGAGARPRRCRRRVQPRPPEAGARRAEKQQHAQEQGESQESSQSAGDESQQSENPSDPNQESDGQSQSDSDEKDGAPRRPEDESAEQAMRELEEELKRAAEEAESQDRPATDEELMGARQQQAEQQAMEQWLRRIPNDPGGLLRRKFRYQYQREGRDQDGNSISPDNEEQPW